ncbi:MAG: SCP2 sterol-binding domain-containing protein, partial [Thermoleophilaceae bacterium]
MDSPPRALDTLIERFDIAAFDGPASGARIRLRVEDEGAWDVVIGRERPSLEKAGDRHPDAELIADRSSWNAIVRDVRGGMTAFQRGRLMVRHNLHLGVS